MELAGVQDPGHRFSGLRRLLYRSSPASLLPLGPGSHGDHLVDLIFRAGSEDSHVKLESGGDGEPG